MPTVLVTGATGNIGRELVHLLSINPRIGEIRVATRDPDSPSAQLLTAIDPAIVHPVRFSTDAECLTEVFGDGVDRMCMITPMVSDMVAWQEAVLGAARGVKRIVKISNDAARPTSEGSVEGTPPAAHWAGEEILRAMDVERAILRPTIFMQHFMIVPGLYQRGDDTFYLPSGDGRMAMVDARDIAFAAADLLLRPKAELPDEPIYVTGPEALTGEDMRDRISLATGRAFQWNKDPAAFEEHSKAVGTPVEIGGVYAAGAEGAFASVHADQFETTFGRRPTSFAKFALDNAAHFHAF
ncbi:MAG: NmrA family NAD(P)-binding protein [Pseudomonadota bacterium]